MASSSAQSQVAEPVLQDSLSYWEKQSATYNGVLGVYDYLFHAAQLTESLPRQAATAMAYALLSMSQRQADFLCSHFHALSLLAQGNSCCISFQSSPPYNQPFDR